MFSSVVNGCHDTTGLIEFHVADHSVAFNDPLFDFLYTARGKSLYCGCGSEHLCKTCGWCLMCVSVLTAEAWCSPSTSQRALHAADPWWRTTSLTSPRSSWPSENPPPPSRPLLHTGPPQMSTNASSPLTCCKASSHGTPIVNGSIHDAFSTT